MKVADCWCVLLSAASVKYLPFFFSFAIRVGKWSVDVRYDVWFLFYIGPWHAARFLCVFVLFSGSARIGLSVLAVSVYSIMVIS